MKMTRVAVLRGGTGDEYDVSMQSGVSVVAALARAGYPVKDVVITKAGDWLDQGMVRTPDQVFEGIDVVFLALHGNYGEDGSIQRILERKHIPFTGSRAFASAMALNKDLTKGYLKQFGIVMPKHFRITRAGTTDPYQTAESIKQLFGPRYVVKPTSSGSSIGTIMVDNSTELALAIANALTDYDDVVVEEQIDGTEATVGVVEGYRNERMYILPPIEIIPPQDSRFFDYGAKYNGSTQEICPGRFSESEKQLLRDAAAKVHQELGLQQYSRSDFIVRNGEVYFLEVNTLPGLTPESLLPKAFAAVGTGYEEMVSFLVDSARV